jgi:uncharacterized protein YwqG
MRTSELSQYVYALLDANRQRGILVQEVFPPVTSPDSKSRFGGLPLLPGGVAWPTSNDGTALHFMAQIYLSELPKNDWLPSKGTLLFFGRLDGEMIWEDYATAGDACRVIFTESEPAAPADSDLTSVPVTVPAMGFDDHFYSTMVARTIVEGSVPSNQVPFCPVVFAPIDTWSEYPLWLPITNPNEEVKEDEVDLEASVFKAYEKLHANFRLSMMQQALRERRAFPVFPPTTFEIDSYWTNDEAYSQSFIGAARRTSEFPRYVIDLRFAVKIWTEYIKELIKNPRENQSIAAQSKITDQLKIVLEQIEKLFSELRGAPAFSSLTEDIKDRSWRIFYVGCKNGIYAHNLQDMIRSSMAMSMMCLSDRCLEEVPASYLTYANERFFRSGGFNQILGYVKSSQSLYGLHKDNILLISLRHNAMMGFNFGDVGECTFWIDKNALAQRDFSKVFGFIQGG